MIPYIKSNDSNEDLTKMKHDLEEEISALKSLIATGNSKLVANEKI